MKKALITTVAALATLSLISGCKDETPKTAETAPEQQQEQQMQEQQKTAASMSGTVVETMDTAGYTYIQVDTGDEKVWAAAPQFKVAVGDPVILPEGMPMKNHHSNTLDRDFDLVYFVDSVMVGGEESQPDQMPEGHPDIETQSAESVDVDLSGIEKAEGGQTVAEIFNNKADLEGKEVKVRGKVVKFNPEIMGKNWIHLQDGTGEAGTNDLTLTTGVSAQVGDTVVATGKLSLNKDFGYGYQYDVIIEDAQVTVEN